MINKTMRKSSAFSAMGRGFSMLDDGEESDSISLKKGLLNHREQPM